MAAKRKTDDVPGLTGREKKKQKTALARTIAVQPTTGSGTSTPSQNAQAGPSRAVHFDNASTLPGSLDVERFAEARAFEINAMHTAMQNARASGTQRAWQQLPRHLRRRAASHDVRRVPARLREKAKAEMDAPKAKKKSTPKRGKAKQYMSRTAIFLKRQEKKVWLETHIWHAKRMHMEDMWGYRLAVSPTEKSFRPSHRASLRGSILHDASYFGLMELRGPEHVLKLLLDSCCDVQLVSPGAKRFVSGTRTCETHLYKRAQYPHGLIAPITVLWCPESSTPKLNLAAMAREDREFHEMICSRKGKERANPIVYNDRVVWIWAHPSVFEEAYLELRTAASFALEAAGKTAPSGVKYEIQMADLREQVNVFEIMGPKSSQVIKGALRPVVDDTREEFKKCWNELSNLQTTASVPRSTVLGFKVYDPRLNFPPKNAKTNIDKEKLPSMSTAAQAFFPSTTLAQSEIWDEEIRHPLRKPKFKKKDIDARRSKNLIPGSTLQAQAQDARIPLLLIQRSVEANAANTPSSSTHTPAVHGWTLILPQGWAMPFLSSLIFTGTRVGGQRERATQAFESGAAHFPRDYPCTAAYDEYSADRADEEEATWVRKPPAKRPNYEKLGSRSPFAPDWDVVLGVRDPADTSAADASTIPGEFVPAQRDMDVDTEAEAPDAAAPPESRAAATDDASPAVAPWLLRGPGTQAILAKATNADALLAELNRLRTKRGLEALPLSVSAEELWKHALVRVRVRMCGRGCPEDLAVLYAMDDDEAGKWLRTEHLRKKGPSAAVEGTEDETELSIVAPSTESIIGYVTSGNYSLSLGEGFAIGAIPLARFVELSEQAKRLGAGSSPLVKVRDRHEAICRAARLEALE